MNHRLRQERANFLLYLGVVYVSLMCALPIVTARLSIAHYAQPQVQAAAPQPTFERFDRDRDGYVDRREAAALPGLETVFNGADRRSDGRLDKVEFARALAMIDGLQLRAESRP